jgi:hypothetical protein
MRPFICGFLAGSEWCVYRFRRENAITQRLKPRATWSKAALRRLHLSRVCSEQPAKAGFALRGPPIYRLGAAAFSRRNPFTHAERNNGAEGRAL